MTLLALTVLGAFAIYIMKPEERKRLLIRALELLQTATSAAKKHAANRRDPFQDALKARTGWPLIVPAIVTYNVVVFVCMLFGSGSFGDPNTMVAWGGNFGPRTTNGEWGRLLVSMFVHGGLLHLMLTMGGLIQVGLIAERLAGYVTFSAVYLMAGLFSSVVSLWLHPMEASYGASGAVFGVYGFLVAAAIWGMHRPTGVTIPLQTVKAFAPAAGLFILYNVVSGALQFEAELAGFAAGFVSGLVLTQDIAQHIPAPRRVMGAVAATFVVAAGLAIPLHGLTDIRPEIEWIVRLEDGTAARYDSAVERFRKGVISSRELARVIERSSCGCVTSVGACAPRRSKRTIWRSCAKRIASR